jgi:uncharacterized membrane protein SpoIIM required for sporulation
MAQSIEVFVAARKPRWERLEALLKSLEKGRSRGLSGSDLQDVGNLYREATADLARLQAFRQEGSSQSDLEIYLSQLVGRAYGQIYRQPSAGWHDLARFLRDTFPRTFRESFPWFLASFGIFLLGFAYGFVVSQTDETFVPLVVPPHLIQKVEEGKVWFDSILAVKPLASSMIMTNNITVSFLAFALGITFGVGTIYLMAFNGLLVGTLAGFCHTHGLDGPFWSFVLPHGVIELTAIFIAGSAGLLLGAATIVPKDLSRRDALVRRARQGGRLVLGCIPLLIAAGVIEGFFSPAELPVGVKFGAAGVLLLLLTGYLASRLTTTSPSASPPGTSP